MANAIKEIKIKLKMIVIKHKLNKTGIKIIKEMKP